MMTIPEDKAFLLSQRQKGRSGSISGTDKVETAGRQRAQDRREKYLKHQERSFEEMERYQCNVVFSASSSSSSDKDTDSNFDCGKRSRPAQESGYAEVLGPSSKRARVNVLSPGLTAALDKIRMTSRNATYVLNEMATSFGHDVATININKNSIQRARSKYRHTRTDKIRSEFTASIPLTLHWDGKLIEELTSHEHVDRLPVLVSGAAVEQLLGVPKLPLGTGEAQASAVMQCLVDWSLDDQIVALCFDTTSSNTGSHSGNHSDAGFFIMCNIS